MEIILQSIKRSFVTLAIFIMCYWSLACIADENIVLAMNGTAKDIEKRDSVLILSAINDSLNDVVSGIEDELDSELIVNVAYGSPENFDKNISKLIKRFNPEILVVLGNQTINDYINFRDKNTKVDHPPVMLLAALYIDKLAEKLTNVTGIRYEIPLVTSGVNLRSLSKSPIKKIGVIHREWLTDYVNFNGQYALPEGLEIVSAVLPNSSRKMDRLVSKRIKKLSPDVDAFWILNDNELLTKKIIVNAWIPGLKKSSKPVIVGVESLVETKFKIGTFSVSPDHYALGTQAASKILDIQYNDWVLESVDIEQPFSVKKIFNQVMSKERNIRVNESRFGELDRVIK